MRNNQAKPGIDWYEIESRVKGGESLLSISKDYDISREAIRKRSLKEGWLETNKNILDYCIGSKTNSGWQVVADSLEEGVLKQENLQKINRYYISDSGVKLIKRNKNDGREIQLEAGKWIQTVFNKIEEQNNWEDYNINKKYYLMTRHYSLEMILPNSLYTVYFQIEFLFVHYLLQ